MKQGNPTPGNQQPLDLSSDATFKRIIAGATSFGFAAVLGSLACVDLSATHGLDFRWHWTALGWMTGGFAIGLWFWRLVWRAHTGASAKARGQFLVFCGALIAAGLAAFAYPIRFVADDRRKDVFIGLAFAIAVLTFVGWMLFRIVKLFNEGEPKENDSKTADGSRLE